MMEGIWQNQAGRTSSSLPADICTRRSKDESALILIDKRSFSSITLLALQGMRTFWGLRPPGCRVRNATVHMSAIRPVCTHPAKYPLPPFLYRNEVNQQVTDLEAAK